LREGKPEVISASKLEQAIPDAAKHLFVGNGTKEFMVYVDTSNSKPRIIYEPITPIGDWKSGGNRGTRKQGHSH
jgi:hypothetical protein